MFLLNNDLVENYIEQGIINIENFKPENLFSTFYYFQLGNEITLWNGKKQELEQIDLDEFVHKSFILPSKSYAIIRSYERFSFSPKIMAMLGQISDLPLAGLKLNYSPTIDPFFHGDLVLGLENLLNKDVEIFIRSNIGKLIFFDISDTPPIAKNIEEKMQKKFNAKKKIEKNSSISDFRARFKSNSRLDV